MPTAAVFRTQTNEGLFLSAASGLAVGEYEVVARMEGFRRVVRSNITLQANQTLQVNFRLQLGAAVETVEVVADVSWLIAVVKHSAK